MKNNKGTYKLFAAKSAGSQIVELAFAKVGVPLSIVDLPWESDWKQNLEFARANSRLEVPTLVLPNGDVLTESGAILAYLNDLVPEAHLFPAIGNPARAQFLRWLFFINSSIYPTFTYGDKPERWVNKESKSQLRSSTDEHRKALWLELESACSQPYFLGEQFSGIDLYLATMNQWRPGEAWFQLHCPRITAVAQLLRSDHRFSLVFEI